MVYFTRIWRKTQYFGKCRAENRLNKNLRAAPGFSPYAQKPSYYNPNSEGCAQTAIPTCLLPVISANIGVSITLPFHFYQQSTRFITFWLLKFFLLMCAMFLFVFIVHAYLQ
jgi:hypothetical protein